MITAIVWCLLGILIGAGTTSIIWFLSWLKRIRRIFQSEIPDREQLSPLHRWQLRKYRGDIALWRAEINRKDRP